MFRDINFFFEKYHKVALAFSGGVDSSFLFYTAIKAGADVKAYYVKTPFQPKFEFEDAKKVADFLGAKLNILYLNILEDPQIRENTKKRCYYCKRQIMDAILNVAHKDGVDCILDGTNADDAQEDRPGMAALTERGVHSPLRECGYTKEEIRQLSKQAGLFTWNKPAYACLATRIKQDEVITEEKLLVTERAESFLSELGFSDFRVRLSGNTAKIQVKENQMEKVFQNRERIFSMIGKDFDSVTLDLKSR